MDKAWEMFWPEPRSLAHWKRVIADGRWLVIWPHEDGGWGCSLGDGYNGDNMHSSVSHAERDEAMAWVERMAGVA